MIRFSSKKVVYYHICMHLLQYEICVNRKNIYFGHRGNMFGQQNLHLWTTAVGYSISVIAI